MIDYPSKIAVVDMCYFKCLEEVNSGALEYFGLTPVRQNWKNVRKWE